MTESRRPARNERPDVAVTVLDEADYLYGAGPVHIHIERVDRVRPVRHDNDTWYEVTGTEYSPSGRRRGPRTMHVRARRLLSQPQDT